MVHGVVSGGAGERAGKLVCGDGYGGGGDFRIPVIHDSDGNRTSAKEGPHQILRAGAGKTKADKSKEDYPNRTDCIRHHLTSGPLPVRPVEFDDFHGRFAHRWNHPRDGKEQSLLSWNHRPAFGDIHRRIVVQGLDSAQIEPSQDSEKG